MICLILHSHNSVSPVLLEIYMACGYKCVYFKKYDPEGKFTLDVNIQDICIQYDHTR